MFKRSALCLMIGLAAVAAAADPPREDVAEANNLLRKGKAEAALNKYRSLQIDDPESELLYYNIGCAELESVKQSGGISDEPTAIEALNNAKKWFDKASMAEDPTIRRDARFNRINSDSQVAKILATGQDREGATKAFEDAIFGYEDFLDQYPGHAGARKNLDHMRYQLKTMLQKEPEEQDQQDQESGEGEENQSGDPQEQQDQQQDQQGDEGDQGDPQEGSDQGQPGDQENEPAPGEQQPGDEPMTDESVREDDDGQPGDDQQEDGSPNEQDGDQPPNAGEDASAAQGTPTEEPVDLPNKDTIEAILNALQERDKEEQKTMRRVPQNPRRAGPWW